RESAGADEFLAIEAALLRHGAQFARRVARVPSPAAAQINPELMRPRVQAALERAEHAGGDPRRMPVHPHHAPQRLKPEGVAQTREELGSPVMMKNALHDRGAELRHALGQPWRYASAMQRKIGMARAEHLCSYSRIAV